jgi:hypothetical protein
VIVKNQEICQMAENTTFFAFHPLHSKKMGEKISCIMQMHTRRAKE